jgi:hypothetical protein
MDVLTFLNVGKSRNLLRDRFYVVKEEDQLFTSSFAVFV